MIKKELKQYTVRKTIRLTRNVLAYSAREAMARCEFWGEEGALRSTKGWWCRKNREER